MSGGNEERPTVRSAEDDAAATERAPVRATLLTPGMVVADKYEVTKLLGAGGMGAVYAARHVGLSNLVAIKVLQGDDILEQDVRRFLREGKTAAQLQNAHAVRIYDIDQLPSGLPFLVMEHLEGEDLGRRLLARGPLPVDLAVTCILQACEVIQEAHALGIVHRDLKPQNLFLLAGAAPNVKVLDFGIAKIVSPDVISASLAGTTDGALLGSPHFMSPEQIRSARTVDHRTDIWSLGATLYKLLVGEAPFVASNVQRLLVEILSTVAPRVRAARPDVNEALDGVVARCLAKSPEARFPSVKALADALAATTTGTAAAPPRPPLDQTLDEVARMTVPMAVPLAAAPIAAAPAAAPIAVAPAAAPIAVTPAPPPPEPPRASAPTTGWPPPGTRSTTNARLVAIAAIASFIAVVAMALVIVLLWRGGATSTTTTTTAASQSAAPSSSSGASRAWSPAPVADPSAASAVTPAASTVTPAAASAMTPSASSTLKIPRRTAPTKPTNLGF